MTITLDLSPDDQAELQRRATAAGTDLRGVILDAVHEALRNSPVSNPARIPFEQWRADFLEWVASHQSRNPRFDDSRQGIYD